MYTVILSDHAKKRLVERAGTDKGARTEIARRLIATLRLGVEPGPDLGVTVYLPDKYKAICYPTWEGTWLVATVLEPEMELREIREAASV
ncbi:MAG TPA: hypothetical protein GXX23_02720 [Firmicutes bacterium]|nr:hypothetical protein [Candidatus Fermentithermobacillaceae bacterium]